jgi:hypothetical protein
VHIANLKKYHKQAKVSSSAPDPLQPASKQVGRSEHQTKVKSGLSCQTVYGTNQQIFGHSVQQGDDCATQQSDDLSVQQNEDCPTQRSDEHSVRSDHDSAAKIGDDCAAQRSDFRRVQSNDGTTETADQ